MLFGFVIFLSAFLLFQIQLIVAKHLLPWFGGTPAVWTTSQMFFQVLLLGGYSYAHALTRSHGPRTQSRVHIAVLVAATIPVFWLVVWGGTPLLAPASMKPAGAENPVLTLLLALGVSVGLPFFAVSTTGPLLQRWHARQTVSLTRTYRFYALSNAGSLLGLLSYPLGVERVLDLPQQAWLWAALFALFAAGCSVIAWRSARHSEFSDGAENAAQPALSPSDERDLRAAGPGLTRIATWLLITVTTSVLFLATTNQLSQDVAAVPFLWALPLATYLLTFILCFDRPQWYSRRWMLVAAALFSIAVWPTINRALPVTFQIVTHAAFLFSFCMLCHGELVRSRPRVAHLTLFYLLIALGGALGGIFVSVVAPAVFPDFWEFELAIVIGWLVIAGAWTMDKGSPFYTGDRWLFASLVTIVLWVLIRYPLEHTLVGSVEWIASNTWTVTLAGGAMAAAILCAALWRSRVARSPRWPQLAMVLLILMSGFLMAQRIGTGREGVLYAARNFYGVVRVVTVDTGGAQIRELRHGTTTHGAQVDDLRYGSTPTAYYSRSSGVAIAARLLRQTKSGGGDDRNGVHFGLVGMGTGTLSAYARTGDRVRYYEINPEIIDIAYGRMPYFTFVKDSAAQATIVPGDARLSLERELSGAGPQQFDLLVIDAFSSDSIPVHLVTVEAFRLYSAHLKNHDSIVAVHVTNRYLDLEPVVAAHARDLGFHGLRVDSPGDPPFVTGSSWILLTRNPRHFSQPVTRPSSGRPLGARLVRFTDQYSNLYRVLK